jgi:hypothetical protein
MSPGYGPLNRSGLDWPADHALAPVGAPMTEDEAGLALAEALALKTDLVFRLDLLHQPVRRN